MTGRTTGLAWRLVAASAGMALVPAICAAQQPEISAWSSPAVTDPRTPPPAPKSKPVQTKPVAQPGKKGAAADRSVPGGASQGFAKDSAPVGPTGMAPVGGDDPAYMAFDQGQYLTALKLAQEAATKGDPQAHTLVGRIYAEGLGVSKDEKLAAQWYARGAELGDVEAAFALGILKIEGRGVPKDPTGAAQLFEAAARKGHPLANYNLGMLFISGQGKPENPYRAFQHIGYAAEKGIAQAQFDLAGLYQRGYGTNPDAYEAARWMRRAADQGLHDAQFEYAVMLLRGQGLNADMPRTVEYLRKAADGGIAGAQNRLAHLYAEGVGVDKSMKEAAKWRLIAKANGITEDPLDAVLERMSRADRQAAERAAQDWRDRGMLGLPADQ